MAGAAPILPRGVRLERTTLERAAALHAALDAVARERRFLSLLEAPPVDRVERFVAEVLASGDVQWLAVAGDSVVGWCDILRNPLPSARHAGRLGVGVVRAWRGRGIGRTLIDVAITEARAQGVTRIELEVVASNAGAARLYESLGFAHEGRKRKARCVDGVYEDVLVMALVD